MNVSVVGTGYVGLVTGAGLAEKGHKVVCVDIVREKIDLINSGKSPIYERGLEEVIKKNIGKNLKASLDIAAAVIDSEITFICVGTPSNKDGSLGLDFIEKVSEDVGKALGKKKAYHVVVVKSTVLPGTTEEKILPILERYSGKKAGKDFGVAMNPEFLKEGVALQDFMSPDRIIVGSLDEKSGEAVKKLYASFKCRIFETDIRTAEMIKYASNAFLAAKISFINEIGNICKKKDIDVYDVSEGMALDHRISPHFLKAGLGWGGSCFPKDLKALIHEAKTLGYDPALLEAASKVNEKQPRLFLELLKKKLGSLKNKRVAVLGLAFKKDTDDVRDSQAFHVIESLLKEGAKINAYDPKAEQNSKAYFGASIRYSDSADSALKDADLAVVLTDWEEFRSLDYSKMKKKVVFDARNVVGNRDDLDYEGLCW